MNFNVNLNRNRIIYIVYSIRYLSAWIKIKCCSIFFFFFFIIFPWKSNDKKIHVQLLTVLWSRNFAILFARIYYIYSLKFNAPTSTTWKWFMVSGSSYLPHVSMKQLVLCIMLQIKKTKCIYWTIIVNRFNSLLIIIISLHKYLQNS